MPKIFKNYIFCFGNFTVHMVDGSFSKMVGTSFVAIFKDLILGYVLLVSNLDWNLLSISKLTQEKNFVIKLFPNHYAF